MIQAICRSPAVAGILCGKAYFGSAQKTFIVDLNSYVGILDTVKQDDLSFA